MNILITGITGSGGSYLAEFIKKEHPECKIHGICRWHSTGTEKNLNLISKDISIYECDLLDLGSIIRTLQVVKPEIIFHLASYANVRKCFDTPLSVVNNNIMGTANLLEGIKLVCPNCILHMCSTSEVYGNPQYTPIDEKHPIQPVNPYAVSKLTQESLSYAYYKSWGLKVIITRMFAYINPRRTDLFASAFAKQIVEIEQGKRKVLSHGNLHSTRTLIDVRDAMEAYWIAGQHCEFGVPYNIGGTTSLKIGEFLHEIIKYSKVPITTYEDPILLRPTDIDKQIPDASLFLAKTNWKPRYSLKDSIEFLLGHYRNET